MTQAITTARPRPGPGFNNVDSATLIDRMPPHDLGAEAAVIGSVIIDPPTIGAVRMFVKPDQFFKEENQIIFRVLCELNDAARAIDAMILHSTLKTKNLLAQVGGIEYITELAHAVPTSAHAEYYAAIVKEKGMLRSLITACTKTLRACYESGDNPQAVMDLAMGLIFKAGESAITKFPRPMSEIVPSMMQKLDEQKAAGAPPGLSTGIKALDNLTQGLQNGHVILIAARPSHGKTALAYNIIEHAAIVDKKYCLMFSLEMNEDALALRAVSSRSGIDSQKIRTLTYSREDAHNIGYYSAEAASPHIYIDDTPGIGLAEVRSKALRMKQAGKLDLLAVDYIGLMGYEPVKGQNRNEQIGAISSGIKRLARELNVPILLLCQLNRSCEDERRPPRTSDLRDSGNLEQDADLIMLIHRECMYHRGDAEWASQNPDKLLEGDVILAKQRNGAADVVTLTYFPWCTRFQDHQPNISQQPSLL